MPLTEHVSGAENGAERAENRRERSGRSSERKRSGERESPWPPVAIRAWLTIVR